jgi:hypothetical protein
MVANFVPNLSRKEPLMKYAVMGSTSREVPKKYLFA